MKKLIILRSRFLCIILIISFLILTSSLKCYSQNVAVTDNEGYSANESAMLDVYSTTKGMLIPRLTTMAKDTMHTPAIGLIVYDTGHNSFFYYTSSGWVKIPQVNSSVVVGSALFAVVNAAGDTIFAVYNDGVKVTVPPGSKGSVGGFAVSGRTQTKGIVETEYFRVTPDSTRIYINDTSAHKGSVGGFAVSGRTQTKAGEFDYLRVTPDSTRVYVNEDSTKGSVGGFAVSGRTQTKGSLYKYMLSTKDSTRIYVNDTSTFKGSVGGFAVSGRTLTKGNSNKFLDLTSKNYLIGQEAGKSLTTGSYNSYMGFQAGKYTRGGSKNIFMGYQAGLKTDNGNENIFIGYQTGNLNLGGNWNTFLGTEAGFSNTGSDNTFIGYKAGRMHQNEGGNVYIGSRAGQEATHGMQNVYIGEKTGYNTSYGRKNVFIGYESGFYNSGDAVDTVKGSFNVYMGYQAGKMGTTNKKNVFIGYQAGMKTIAGTNPDLGNYNVFIGSEAGLNNTLGKANAAIGEQALKSNTEGYWNVAIGKEPLVNNTIGRLNVSIGNKSLLSNIDGNANIALGTGALYLLQSGNENVALGSAALGVAMDSSNVAVGSKALTQLRYGVCNTAIGYMAGVNNPPPLYPTIYNNTIAIGFAATATLSNQVVIGNNDISNVTIPGVYNATTTQASNVYVNSSGQVMRTTASMLTGTGTANKLAFWNGTNTLSYNSNLHWDNTNSRLGIGTSTPSYTLDIAGPINLLKGWSDGIALYVNGIEALWSNGTNFTWGYGGTLNYFEDIVSIGTTDNSSKLNVYTSSASGFAAQFFNDGNGTSYWGIKIQAGEDTPTGTNNFVRFLDGDGNIEGAIRSVAGTLELYNTSDARLKTNIKSTVKLALPIIKNIRVVDFSFIDDKNKAVKTGFIAQELEKVFPDMISIDEETGFYGIANGRLVPILTKAIQEQQDIIESLVLENSKLQNDYNDLRREVDLIKNHLSQNN